MSRRTRFNGTVSSQDLQGTNNRYRFNSNTLPKWAKALANVRNGLSDAKILCVGDSTTKGLASSTHLTIPDNKGYPNGLANLLNSYLVPSAPGLGIPPSALNVAADKHDDRWTVPTGWSLLTAGIGLGAGGNCDYLCNNGVVTALTYADPRINADRFDVYYATQVAVASLTATATGGTPVVQSTNAAIGIGKITVSAAAAATTNTLTMTFTGGGHIMGVEPWLSTTPKVRVGNAGVGSARGDHWNLNSTTNGGIPLIKTYAPNLTVISLGVNDAIGTIATPTFMTNVQNIITAAAISGDVVLMSPVASSPSPTAAIELDYTNNQKGLTYPLADLYGRMGTWAAWNTLGMMNGDNYHPNDYGYLDMAQFVFTSIRDV